jgi:hypothetical protein
MLPEEDCDLLTELHRQLFAYHDEGQPARNAKVKLDIRRGPWLTASVQMIRRAGSMNGARTGHVPDRWIAQCPCL